MKKVCEICGKEKPLSEFSKSYKNRCKECVAEMTRENRRAEKEFKEIRQIKKELVWDESTIDWNARRYEIAKEAMTAIMSNQDFYGQVLDRNAERGQRQIQNSISEAAVIFADALIAELQKKQ